MEKKEFQKIFKDYMKGLGFQSKGNISWKYLSEDYMIAVMLDHSSYTTAYYITYGVVYEADKMEKPFRGKRDWSESFYFTKDPADDLSAYPIENLCGSFYRSLIGEFDYQNRSVEDFMKSFAINIEKRLQKLHDREYVLNLYREDWILFRMIPYDTVGKIARLAGLDYEEVVRVRDSRLRKWQIHKMSDNSVF